MKKYTPGHLDLFIRSSIENIYNDDREDINNEADLKSLMYHYLYPLLKNSNFRIESEVSPEDMGQKKVDLCILDKEDYIIRALEFKYNLRNSSENKNRIKEDENKLIEIIKNDPKKESKGYFIWFNVDPELNIDNRIILIKKRKMD